MPKAKSASKAKKVVILLGSPRRAGNSAALADRIAEGARGAGAEVTSFYLHGMKIAPCRACEACHEAASTGCVVQDDMQTIYPKLTEADAVVFAGPIYFFTVSAQMKLAMDRCYGLGGAAGHKFTGKKIGLAFTFGGEDPFDSGCTNAIRAFQDAFRYLEAEIVGMVYASAGGPGEVKANAKVMGEAFELGRKLVS